MGFLKKPKAPKPTGSEIELERSQRSELDKLTRDENERLKAIKRRQRGRQSLFGSAGVRNADETLGTVGGGTAGGPGGRRGRGGGGSILSSASRAGGRRSGSTATSRNAAVRRR